MLALREAQKWLRDTTNAEKAAYFQENLTSNAGDTLPETIAAEFYSRVASLPADRRDFAHPECWSAFFLTVT